MYHYMPTRLYVGEGCIAAHAGDLRALGSRCLLVTGRHAAKASGALDDVLEALAAQDIVCAIWDGVRENPSVASCIEAGRYAAEQGAQFVIGIGGGSSLDAAKAVAVFATNPKLSEESFYAKEWAEPPLPIALVGTTAGTGSEVTKVSVLTDATKHKHSINDDSLFAVLSYGDARYTQSCSRATTLSCGVDALAHALESYFSRRADELSRAHATKATRMLTAPLAKAAAGETLSEEQYRQLYEASIVAGFALNTTGTCFPHNVGYYLTEAYGLPHGFACATFLPALLARMDAEDASYARTFYTEAGTDRDELDQLIAACLPASDIHMTAEEIEGQLPRWENNSTINNTRAEVTTADIRAMLTELFV
jgi:alcohol dehydrogenase class IV